MNLSVHLHLQPIHKKMNIPNLHSLLSAITIGQLKIYLASKGWTEHPEDGRLSFAKEFEQGEWQRVFVPADRAHPRFRSLLQNLMFSLAVIESREPAEIANDIASFQVPIPTDLANVPEQLHAIASILRGIVHECNATEAAKGKILELARFLLNTHSMTMGLTPKLANELWDVASSDHSYLPSATSEWLEANVRKISVK